jgi:heme A synthase
MQVTFKIYNHLRIAATFFLALIIIAGVIYNLSQAKIRAKVKVQNNL